MLVRALALLLCTVFLALPAQVSAAPNIKTDAIAAIPQPASAAGACGEIETSDLLDHLAKMRQPVRCDVVLCYADRLIGDPLALRMGGDPPPRALALQLRLIRSRPADSHCPA